MVDSENSGERLGVVDESDFLSRLFVEKLSNEPPARSRSRRSFQDDHSAESSRIVRGEYGKTVRCALGGVEEVGALGVAAVDDDADAVRGSRRKFHGRHQRVGPPLWRTSGRSESDHSFSFPRHERRHPQHVDVRMLGRFGGLGTFSPSDGIFDCRSHRTVGKRERPSRSLEISAQSHVVQWHAVPGGRPSSLYRRAPQRLKRLRSARRKNLLLSPTSEKQRSNQGQGPRPSTQSTKERILRRSERTTSAPRRRRYRLALAVLDTARRRRKQQQHNTTAMPKPQHQRLRIDSLRRRSDEFSCQLERGGGTFKWKEFINPRKKKSDGLRSEKEVSVVLFFLLQRRSLGRRRCSRRTAQRSSFDSSRHLRRLRRAPSCG